MPSTSFIVEGVCLTHTPSGRTEGSQTAFELEAQRAACRFLATPSPMDFQSP